MTCVEPGRPSLAQNNCQKDNDQNNSQNEQQTACFVACCFLVSARTPQLDVGSSSVSQGVLDIDINGVYHVTLLPDDMGDIAEQFIELADRLFDLANFAFTFDDEVLLEIDFALVGYLGLLE